MAFPRNAFELATRHLVTVERTVEWLREVGLLAANPPACPTPACPGQLYEGQYGRCQDGTTWRCRACRKVVSIRKGSFFDKRKASLSQLIRAVYYIATQASNDTVMREADLAKATVVDWANFVREVMSEDILRHPEMLGGPGVVVQIDESLLSRAKPALNGVARQAPAQWVFGMVDSNGRAHIQLVPDRSGDTLLAVVRAHVLPGSEIWSDQWAGYAGRLAAAGYVHHSVNHSVQFVRADGVHTNAAEGMWSNMKAKLKRMRGTRRHLLPGYLDEFMWLQRHGRNNTFEEILRCIAEQYPV